MVNPSAPQCKNTGPPQCFQPALHFFIGRRGQGCLIRSDYRSKNGAFSLVVVVVVLIIFIVVAIIFISIVMRLMHLVIPELTIRAVFFDQFLV